MKGLKLKRNTWCLTGLCFLVLFVLNLADGKASYLNYTLIVIAAAASFVSAYTIHKKITSKE
jgi:hypothetical protein